MNPSVWFQNGEYVAADKIGAERVTYGANIFKDYVAYRFIMEEKAKKEVASKVTKK